MDIFKPSLHTVTQNDVRSVTVCLPKRQKRVAGWHFGRENPPGRVFQLNTGGRRWKDLEQKCEDVRKREMAKITGVTENAIKSEGQRWREEKTEIDRENEMK